MHDERADTFADVQHDRGLAAGRERSFVAQRPVEIKAAIVIVILIEDVIVDVDVAHAAGTS